MTGIHVIAGDHVPGLSDDGQEGDKPHIANSSVQKF